MFLQVACPAYTQPQFYDIQYTSVSGTVSYCILRMLECSYRELALLAPNHSFMTYSIPLYQDCVILHPEDVGVFLQVACPAYTQPQFYDIQYTSVSGTVSYCILRMLECSYRELALLAPNHCFMTYSIPLYQDCVILHPEDVGVFLQGACPACTQPLFYDIQYTSVSGTVSYCILRMLECSYR